MAVFVKSLIFHIHHCTLDLVDLELFGIVTYLFNPRNEAHDGTASPHGYHTEKKTHVVWPPGQTGRDS